MNYFKTAVILAGGRSSRMGFDKQFLKINDKLLLEETVSKLKEQFEDVLVVSNKSDKYKNIKVRIVEDEIVGKGPLSGLHIGLKESKSKFAYFIACDMPNVNIEYIKFMKKQLILKGADACLTKGGKGIEPFNAFYSNEIVTIIEKQLERDKKSIKELLNNINTLYIEEEIAKTFSKDWEMFINLNTQEELRQIQK